MVQNPLTTGFGTPSFFGGTLTPQVMVMPSVPLAGVSAPPVFNSDIFRTGPNLFPSAPPLGVSTFGFSGGFAPAPAFGTDVFQTSLQNSLGLNQTAAVTTPGGLFNPDIFATGPSAFPAAGSLAQPAFGAAGGVFNSDIFRTAGLSPVTVPGTALGGLPATGTVGFGGFGSDIFRTGGLGTSTLFGGSPTTVVGDGSGFASNGDPVLQAALSGIAQDPVGGGLLQAAQAQGFNIRVGVPQDSAGTGTGGNARIEGITTVGRGIREIMINPNARDFVKTLAHELYHASTSTHNSVQEEINANIVGDQIAARVNGRPPRDPAVIAAETRPLYPELPEF